MKRSGALKRKTPLRRGNGLAPGKPLQRSGKGLRARSKKTTTVYREQRVPLVKEILTERPFCELRLPEICWGRSTTVHEVKTRGRGGSIVNKANCLASCVPCNDHVADPKFADLAAERGLLKHSWEDEG